MGAVACGATPITPHPVARGPFAEFPRLRRSAAGRRPGPLAGRLDRLGRLATRRERHRFRRRHGGAARRCDPRPARAHPPASSGGGGVAAVWRLLGDRGVAARARATGSPDLDRPGGADRMDGREPELLLGRAHRAGSSATGRAGWMRGWPSGVSWASRACTTPWARAGSPRNPVRGSRPCEVPGPVGADRRRVPAHPAGARGACSRPAGIHRFATPCGGRSQPNLAESSLCRWHEDPIRTRCRR